MTPRTAAAPIPKLECPRRPDPDRDDRLAEGDDHDQAVALGEVLGNQFPARRRDQVGPTQVEEQHESPESPLGEAVEKRGDDQQRDGDRRAEGEAEHRVAQGVVVGAGEDEEPDLGDADEPVGEGEDQGQVAEGLRHAERDDQQRRHRAEDHQADRSLLGVDDAGQPGVSDPRPPDHAEDQQALGEARPGGFVRHQRSALGDREDEDEVEEELQRRYPAFPFLAEFGAQAGLARMVSGGHRRQPIRACED